MNILGLLKKEFCRNSYKYITQEEKKGRFIYLSVSFVLTSIFFGSIYFYIFNQVSCFLQGILLLFYIVDASNELYFDSPSNEYEYRKKATKWGIMIRYFINAIIYVILIYSFVEISGKYGEKQRLLLLAIIAYFTLIEVKRFIFSVRPTIKD